MIVAIQVADLDDRGGRGEMLENGALVDAVAAPGAGQTKDIHLAAEAAEQLTLRAGERNLRMQLPPAFLLILIGIPGKKCFVRQTLLEFLKGVHRQGPFISREE